MGDISPPSPPQSHRSPTSDIPKTDDTPPRTKMTRPTASTLYSFLLPTIFLNPVLFLHSLNALLTRLLPPMAGHDNNIAQPHIDIHASESLCWGYTALMVWAQMAAFLRFDRLLKEQERVRLGRGEKRAKKKEDNGYG